MSLSSRVGLFAFVLAPYLAVVNTGCSSPASAGVPPESSPDAGPATSRGDMAAAGAMSKMAAPVPAPMAAAPMRAPMAPPMAKMAAREIGFSAGGAKDVGTFRTNIQQGLVPHPSSLSYEGLYYDYYFDTGRGQPCRTLFCPSYARAISRDPFSQRPVHFLAVGLNSNLTEATFARKKLNLVVVLDISGSMGSPFDEYYYDRGAARRTDDRSARKINVATRSIAAMLDHLRPDDRFGMVLFDDSASVVHNLGRYGDSNAAKLKGQILALRERGSTNVDAGIQLGTQLFSGALGADPNAYENRIVLLTDAQPNTGDTSETGLLGRARSNAARGIYTTFVGIGVDFNTELVSSITKVRGANYFSVHSSTDFRRRLADEFDFMVTPMVFDLDLKLDSRAYRIAGVYGSPEADRATGALMHVNTLFPSRTDEAGTRGGVILLELEPTGTKDDLRLRVTYEDRAGKRASAEQLVSFDRGSSARTGDFFDNGGIRKAVLLARYASVLQTWMRDVRASTADDLDPEIARATGIAYVAPDQAVLGRWEQTSVRLNVTPKWRVLLGDLAQYFDAESNRIGDPKLSQESAILKRLAAPRATVAM